MESLKVTFLFINLVFILCFWAPFPISKVTLYRKRKFCNRGKRRKRLKEEKEKREKKLQKQNEIEEAEKTAGTAGDPASPAGTASAPGEEM